jgi:hypothetical protein
MPSIFRSSCALQRPDWSKANFIPESKIEVRQISPQRGFSD